jgi:hypothetical protein
VLANRNQNQNKENRLEKSPIIELAKNIGEVAKKSSNVNKVVSRSSASRNDSSGGDLPDLENAIEINTSSEITSPTTLPTATHTVQAITPSKNDTSTTKTPPTTTTNTSKPIIASSKPVGRKKLLDVNSDLFDNGDSDSEDDHDYAESPCKYMTLKNSLLDNKKKIENNMPKTSKSSDTESPSKKLTLHTNDPYVNTVNINI